MHTQINIILTIFMQISYDIWILKLLVDLKQISKELSWPIFYPIFAINFNSLQFQLFEKMILISFLFFSAPFSYCFRLLCITYVCCAQMKRSILKSSFAYKSFELWYIFLLRDFLGFTFRIYLRLTYYVNESVVSYRRIF